MAKFLSLLSLQEDPSVFKNDYWNETSVICQGEIQKLHDGLLNSELWSLQMIDSSSKLPTGILTGNLIDLGNYDECLRIISPVQGQHCLANIYLSPDYFGNFTAPGVPLTWSYCIPSGCEAKDLQTALGRVLANIGGVFSNVTVRESDCVTKSGIELSAVDVFSVCFCGLVIFACILSTVFDIWKPRRVESGFFTAFSFYSNGRRLFNVSKQSSEELRPLHGLRFLSIAWILLGHRYFWMSTSAVMNLSDLVMASERISFQILSGATLAVDTFFLISGFLNAYNLLIVLNKTQSFPILKYYSHRYIRTTPALAALVLAYVSWYNLIGDGPLWEKTVAVNRQLCQENWWPTLLYISNYYNPISQCAGQSWYLAVDMQLYWLSPLVIIPCWKWPKLTKIYLSILLATSAAAQFTIAYLYEIKVPFPTTQENDDYVKISERIYTPTHARATPYIMGIMCGFYYLSLHKFERRLYIPRVVVLLGWVLSTILCTTVILGNYPLELPDTSHPYDQLESSFYIGFFRIAWCCGIIWTAFACLSGYGGIINFILSWEIFIPFSRLSYCIYICHMAVQQYQLGTIRTTAYYQDFDTIHRFFGDFCVSILVSAVWSLTFESPFIALEKYIMSALSKRKVTNGVDNEAFEENHNDVVNTGV